MPSEPFARQLRRELAACGLIPPQDRTLAVCAAVVCAGRAERRRAARAVGLLTWRRAMAASGLPDPPTDAIRILGWGRLLTEYLVAPVIGPGQAGYEAVIRLGAQANLIVTLYDSFRDHHAPGGEPLSRSTLDALSRRPSLWQRIAWRHPAPARSMARLVLSYFDRLDRLPFAHRHGHVRRAVTQLIGRMYEAEQAMFDAANGGRSLPARAVQMKSVYPFVTMGLPAWLAAPQVDPTHLLSHVRWLYRVGAFLAWIDDAVDVAYDRAAGRPNLVAGALSSAGSPAEEAALAQRIARAGQRAAAGWRATGGPGSAAPAIVSDALRACLASWLSDAPAEGSK